MNAEDTNYKTPSATGNIFFLFIMCAIIGAAVLLFEFNILRTEFTVYSIIFHAYLICAFGIGGLCGIWLANLARNKDSTNYQFHYHQNVKIIKGFYSGFHGQIYEYQHGGNYTVAIDKGRLVSIPYENLEAADKLK